MRQLTYLFLLLLLVASCTPQRRMVYLQQKEGTGQTLQVFVGEYRLKPADILHVRVMTFDKDDYALFNVDDPRMMRTGMDGAGDLSLYLYGYTVTQEGNIRLPVIGDMKVVGLTIDQTQNLMQQQVDEYLIGANVTVKLVNFSVTVMGEVRRPGNYYIYDNEFTVMDALGLAGDLTDYGNRNVRVIRRTERGMEFYEIDITDRQAVTSDKYYLQPGDLVYVEPLQTKRAGFEQFPFSLVLSAITTTLLLVNFFSR